MRKKLVLTEQAQGNFSNIVGWPADTTTLSATAPSAPTSNAAATTNGVDNCSQCSIYAPSVTIYYFPSGSQVTNTACLTGALAVHTDPPPAGYENLYFTFNHRPHEYD